MDGERLTGNLLGHIVQSTGQNVQAESWMVYRFSKLESIRFHMRDPFFGRTFRLLHCFRAGTMQPRE
jgi:hypothetical protein